MLRSVVVVVVVVGKSEFSRPCRPSTSGLGLAVKNNKQERYSNIRMDHKVELTWSDTNAFATRDEEPALLIRGVHYRLVVTVSR